MNNTIKAKCVDSEITVVVNSKELVVEDVTILGNGAGESSGLLILDGLSKYYLPQGKADIAEVIDQVVDVTNQLMDLCSSIASGMAGAGTAPPPTLPADIAQLTASIADLEGIKDRLL